MSRFDVLLEAAGHYLQRAMVDRSTDDDAIVRQVVSELAHEFSEAETVLEWTRTDTCRHVVAGLLHTKRAVDAAKGP